MTIQPFRAWWFQKFVGSWQINGFWAWRQFVDSPLIPWVCCVLGNVSLNVGESKCSSSGRRSLARRGPSVGFSTGRRRFFYRCLKYLPHLVKTRAMQKANVSFLPLHVFWQLKKFCFLREPRLACFFFGENLNAKDPADASRARMDQGKSPIWARTSPSLRAPGFPLFFGLLSFSSPYPPTKKWK